LPDGVYWADLTTYMRTKYGPLSKQFQCWQLDNSPDWSCGEVVECLMFLALVFPNLGFNIPDSPEERVGFMAKVHNYSMVSVFLPHAKRLMDL
ncbi:hypothetical protein FBU31_006117, partial [Coemansia sp. 'formosensis']